MSKRSTPASFPGEQPVSVPEVLRLALDHMDGWFLLLSASGRILGLNRQAAQAIDESTTVLMGRDFGSVFKWDSGPSVLTVRAAIQRASGGEPVELVANSHASAGGVRSSVRLRFCPLQHPDASVRAIAVYGAPVTEPTDDPSSKCNPCLSEFFRDSKAIQLLIDPADGRIVDANAAAEEFYGWSKEALKSMAMQDINALTSRQIVEEVHRAEHEHRHHYYFRHRVASGAIREVEVHSGPLRVGERPLLYSIVQDISDRRMAEAKLRGQAEILGKILRDAPLSELLDDLARFVEGLTTEKRCLVLLADPERNILEHGATPSLPESFINATNGLPITGDGGPSCVAALERQPVIVVDVEASPKSGIKRDLFRALGIRSCWAYPILATDGRLLGTFAIYGVANAEPTPGEAEVIGFSLSLARLILERHMAAARLLDSEQQFRATFEQAAVGVAHIDISGRWLRVNQRLCELLGYSREQLLALRFQDIAHPEDLPTDLENTHRLLAGTIPYYAMEQRYRCCNGHYRWINLTVSLVRDAHGLARYFIAVIEDNAEAKQYRSALEASRDRLSRQQASLLYLINHRTFADAEPAQALRLLTENAAEAIQVQRAGFWILDQERNLISCMDEFDRALGTHTSGAELRSEDFPSYFKALNAKNAVIADNAREHPATAAFTESYLEPLGIGAMLDIPIRLHGRVRGVLCLEEVGPPRIWAEDEVMYALSLGNLVALIFERQEREKVERSLRASEQSLRDTLESTPNVAVKWLDEDGRVIYWNPASETLYGWGSSQAVGQTLEQFLLDKASCTRFRDYMDVVRSSDKAAGPFEMRCRHRNGRYRTVLSTLFTIPGDEIRARYFVCMDIDISDHKRYEREIEKLAFYDPLTALPNRRLFMDRLQHAVTNAKRIERFGALLFIDLDRFKYINDALGHSIGDLILVEVGRRMAALVRDSDTLARLGGDEFVLLLENLSSSEREAATIVRRFADKLMTVLNRPIALRDQQHYISASIGTALFPDRGSDAEEMLKQADTAMYRAKAEGRSRVCLFEARMQVEAELRLTTEKALRDALDREELTVYYQPQVDAVGRIVSCEALVRWNRAGLGLVAPSEFIPIAEESGLIVALGDWVLRRACQAIAETNLSELGCKVSVNVSPRQFQQPDFDQQVLRVMNEVGIEPSLLTLELTESAVINDVKGAAKKMLNLKQHGIQFSIDDFGTGYSSLVYLRQLPVNEIKIDRTFIVDVIDDENDAVIVEAIIAMAERLKLRVIAEGVESEQHVDFLRDRGCQYYQGYHFGRPMPFERFQEILRDRAN